LVFKRLNTQNKGQSKRAAQSKRPYFLLAKSIRGFGAAAQSLT
jgi:hypothetical protein